MSTTFTFKMTTTPWEDIENGSQPGQMVSVVLRDADEMTLPVLLDHIAHFIASSGYLVHGPLEFTKMEEERLMRTLKAK